MRDRQERGLECYTGSLPLPRGTLVRATDKFCLLIRIWTVLAQCLMVSRVRSHTSPLQPPSPISFTPTVLVFLTLVFLSLITTVWYGVISVPEGRKGRERWGGDKKTKHNTGPPFVFHELWVLILTFKILHILILFILGLWLGSSYRKQLASLCPVLAETVKKYLEVYFLP